MKCVCQSKLDAVLKVSDATCVNKIDKIATCVLTNLSLEQFILKFINASFPSYAWYDHYFHLCSRVTGLAYQILMVEFFKLNFHLQGESS